MSKFAASFLLSASALFNPTTPNALPFDASAFVMANNQIRVAVQKTTEVPVVIFLRNQENQILFRAHISKKESAYAVKLNVEELTDGQYELEVKSNEGSIRKQLKLSTKPIQQTSRLVAVQ